MLESIVGRDFLPRGSGKMLDLFSSSVGVSFPLYWEEVLRVLNGGRYRDEEAVGIAAS